LATITITFGQVRLILDYLTLWQVGEAEKEMQGANGVNPYAQLVDEAEGLDRIEHLQNHAHEAVYEKAVSILETFFDVEDGDVENLTPQMDGQGTYSFGANPGQQQAGTFNFAGGQ
jgi:importin subunit alpha-1